jgi:hypothetical protein
MRTRRLSLVVVAGALVGVGFTPVAATAADTTRTPSAQALENARVEPGKPYGTATGRKN